MTESTESGPSIFSIQDSNWLSRHGTTFEWTHNDNKIFIADYKNYIKHKYALKRFSIKYIIAISIFYILFVMIIVSTAILSDLGTSFYRDPSTNFAAGCIVSATISPFALLIISLIFSRKKALSDPRWSFTIIRVGVEDGVFWQYKHDTLAIYTSTKAFVDVVVTDRLIMAFVNKTAAHVFPREKLATSEEGRKVLKWFAVSWPDRMKPAPIRRRPTLLDRVRRGLLFVLQIGAFALAAGAIILGIVFIENWLHSRTAPPSPVSGLDQHAASQSSPRTGNLNPTTLSGRSASDFLDRIVHARSH